MIEDRKTGSPVGCLIVAALLSACAAPPAEVDRLDPSSGPKATAGLIPIDPADTGYTDVQLYAKDTVTPDGWAIHYLVKDDSTRYNDLYIRWSKGGREGLFQCGDVLLMRRYFIPEFTGENDSHIFLEHGCATGCAAMLALSKDTLPMGQDIPYLVDQDLPRGRFVHIPERSFSLDTLEVDVLDLTRKEEHAVVFGGRCTLVPEEGCIDSVSFEDRQVTLYATLLDANGQEVQEKHAVHIPTGHR
ncbi:MAG: hypothetical protein JST66_15620 [Bacteroidetes bacterium]|nr:hypothetical protein [Bacteroidota bacterium]